MRFWDGWVAPAEALQLPPRRPPLPGLAPVAPPLPLPPALDGDVLKSFRWTYTPRDGLPVEMTLEVALSTERCQAARAEARRAAGDWAHYASQDMPELVVGLCSRIRRPNPGWLAERQYLASLIKHLNHLDLRPIPGPARKEVRLTVEGVYVPVLLMTTPPAPENGRGKGPLAEERPKPIPISRLIADHSRMTVIGPMGSGKSFLLRRVALALARAGALRGPLASRRARRLPSAQLEWSPDRCPIPILIPLADFTHWLRHPRRAPQAAIPSFSLLPVGIFPEGESPYHALDMAGNVWEWRQDWYAPDYYAHSPRVEREA